MEPKKPDIAKIQEELQKQFVVDEKQEKQINKLEKELAKQKERTLFAMNLSFKAMKFLQNETKKQVGTAMIAAFGFLIALVWKDAITNYTTHIISFLKIPSPESFQVLYIAIITSMVAIFGIIFVNLWMPKQEDLLKKNPLT